MDKRIELSKMVAAVSDDDLVSFGGGGLLRKPMGAACALAASAISKIRVAAFLGGPEVDLLIGALPSALARSLDQVLDVAGLAICLILLWFGGVNFKFAYAFNSTQMKYYNIPEWWLLSVFVVSFTLLSVEFISRMIRGGTSPEKDQHAAGGF